MILSFVSERADEKFFSQGSNYLHRDHGWFDFRRQIIEDLLRKEPMSPRRASLDEVFYLR